MKGNLERLLKCLRGYYRLHLGLVLDTQRMPDLVRLARNGDIIEVVGANVINFQFSPKTVAQIDKMILLVVGSAVTCPDRSHHISRILSTTDIKESSIITYHTQQVNCIKQSLVITRSTTYVTIL